MTDKKPTEKMTGKEAPEVIEDAKLDDASGGLGMLLPAVQKVREAASTTSTTTPTAQLNLKTSLGDGSV